MDVTADGTAVVLGPEGLAAVLGAAAGALARQRGDGLAVQDASGRYLHASPELLAWFGCSGEQLLGRSDADVFEPSLAAALRTATASALVQPGALASEHRLERGGHRHELAVWRVAVAAPGGRPVVVSVWSDLGPAREREHQLRRALEQIELQQRAHDIMRRELAEQTRRDPASGLFTPAHFDDQLRREVDLSTREHREFALVLIELDPPSAAVQAAGAPAEQSILAATGRVLRSGTRAMDASCRIDERRFAVLLSGVGLATAHSRMEGLRRRCATEIVVHEGRALSFTVAMGVASFPHTAQTQPELVAACEAALAEARRRGGNQVTLASIRLAAPT